MGFHTDSFPIQQGRGNFIVGRYSLQRGRGLGGIFASLFKKIAPFGMSFLKSGKDFINSETGKSILNDTKFRSIRGDFSYHRQRSRSRKKENDEFSEKKWW